MLGCAHPSGFCDGPRRDARAIALYYGMSEDRVVRAAKLIESGDRPEILLLQSPNRKIDKLGATVLYPSVWSNAYTRFGTPYEKVHWDFHYQVMFCALALLAEVGCKRIRFDNPMSGRPWRRDSYICLLEATRSVIAHVSRQASVWLKADEHDPIMPREVDANMSEFDLQKHRPIGISLHIHEGMNMRTVFVEKAEEALRIAGMQPQSETDGQGYKIIN